ncbi:hypothetical protein, partial [Acidisphaera sp. L21]|uniref:hypothetical protein n=1 Tax=Acidisphaera sp. L21 TaxID=1641851 RepID=UPI00131DA264
MAPSFDIEGGVPLVLARGLWLVALLSVAGTLLFQVLVAPRALARAPARVAMAVHRRVQACARASL